MEFQILTWILVPDEPVIFLSNNGNGYSKAPCLKIRFTYFFIPSGFYIYTSLIFILIDCYCLFDSCLADT